MIVERTERRNQRLRTVLTQRQATLAVVIENVHDPHNVAAVMRTCDAVGVLDLHLVYTFEPLPDFAFVGTQSSAGAKKWLRLHAHACVADCYAVLRAAGMRILASHLDPAATDSFTIDWTQPTAIVLGNEHSGVSDEARTQADGTYFIPMMGMVQSLNISVAGAVTLYEALRQRRAAGIYDQPSLPAAEFDSLLSRWTAL